MDSAKGLSDSFSYAFPIFCYNSDIAKFKTWYLKKEILQLFLFVYVLIKIVCLKCPHDGEHLVLVV